MTDTQPTHLDLDTIQARANAATPGPWDYFDGDDYADIAADYHQTGRGSYTCRQGIARIEADSFFDDPAHEDADEDDAADQMRSNAAFIVAARTDVPALIARIRDLEAERERRRARLVAFQNDALDMRGSLSPNGQDRKVPFELGDTLTPAVDWLLARVADLEQQLAACDDLHQRAIDKGDKDRERARALEQQLAAIQARPHLWDVDHPYYACEGNYFASDHHTRLTDWRDFTDTTFYNFDRDQNLLYRWDWRKPGHHDWDGAETLSLYFMLQRKAIACSVEMPISEADEPAVREFLQECAQHITAIWEPILTPAVSSAR